MNSRLYVPDPKQWVKYFKPSERDSARNTEHSQSITLTSPVQSTVDQAKSEMAYNTIKGSNSVKPLIASRKRIKKTSHSKLSSKTQKKSGVVKKKLKKKVKKSKRQKSVNKIKDIFG